MARLGRPLKWTVAQRLDRLFAMKIVAQGGVIKRKRSHLLRYIPDSELKAEVQRRDFHMAYVGEYVVIFCFSGMIGFVT